MTTYNFISDPAHGWLKVPLDELLRLGIVTEISSYSFMDSRYGYLEEDCDAGLFLDKKSDAGEIVDFDFTHQERTPIRRMARFSSYRATEAVERFKKSNG